MRNETLIDLVLVDPDDPRTFARQVCDAIRRAILGGTLRPGQALPSSRQLARSQGLARNTIIAAYDQLASEGFVVGSERSATRVADLGPASAGGETTGRQGPALSVDKQAGLSRRGRIMVGQPWQESHPGAMAFHPGTPDISRFPFALWRRIVAARLGGSGGELAFYHAPAGLPALRRAIASHLALSRNVRCDPDQIVVTCGAQSALDLICRLLLDPGDVALMEEPGYAGARAALLAAGADLVPLPVSTAGWDLTVAARRPFRLAYLTPACQMPSGVTMRMDQRLRLIELATAGEAWLVEDDFDGEFRFAGQPIPSLQGQDASGRVIYVGTFAKTLFPALRLGYAVMPRSLSGGLGNAVAHTGQYPPLILQAALADFMEAGHFARHVRAMRRHYARRRDNFIAAIGQDLGDWLQLVPSGAGIQTLWTLSGPWADVALARAGRREGLSLSPFSTHFWQGEGVNGLVLGYAALDENQRRLAIGRLARLLARQPF